MRPLRIRSACIALIGLMAAAAGSALAQSAPAATSAAASAVAGAAAGAAASVAGTWSGTLNFEKGAVDMTLTLAQVDTGYTGNVRLVRPDREVMTGMVRSVRLENGTWTVLADADNSSVHFTGRLSDQAFGGFFDATENGHLVAQGDWSLTRVAPGETAASASK
jgi:hypothetical protein